MTVLAGRWRELLFYPAALAVAVGCIIASFVQLGETFVPSWRGGYLVVLCAAAAVESYFSYRYLRDPVRRLSGTWKYHLGEAVVAYLLVAVGANLAAGRGNPIEGVPNASGATIAGCALVGLAWLGTWFTARDLWEVGEPVEHSSTYVPPIDRLAVRFLTGGVLLLVASGLTRVAFTELVDLSRAPVAGVILNVIVYLIVGLLVLVQGRYLTLRREWAEQRAVVADGMARSWGRYAAALLVVAAVVAVLLPTDFGAGLLDSLRVAMGAVVNAVMFAVGLILAPFLWLLSLFGGHGGKPQHHNPPPIRHLQPPPTTHAGGVDWLSVLRSAVFWLVIVVLVYLARVLVAHRSEIAAGARGIGLLRLISRLWSALLARLHGYARVVGARMPRGLPQVLGRARRAMPLPAFARPGPASAREQVLRYYASVLRRARDQGIPRRHDETPEEYRSKLGERVPEARGDVDAITGEFVEARYSAHQVGDERARRARASWGRITAALKLRSHPGGRQ